MGKIVRLTESQLKKVIESVINEEKFLFGKYIKDKWYLVKIDDEFFAEKMTELAYHDKPKIVLYRDSNNNVMSFGKDEKWASKLIQDMNEINGL